MCRYTRLVRNRYTNKVVRVSCGKCPSCLQQKANARAARIRNHADAGLVYLFVTLTYLNEFVPYIRKSELLLNRTSVNVYRDKSVRSYRGKFFVNDTVKVITEFDFSDGDFVNQDIMKCMSLRRYDSDKVGVCLYSDVQDFFKRLRINLIRKHGYYKRISYYGCTEYGPITKRPHCHLLIQCESNDVEVLRTAIVESWPYADKLRTYNYVEVARDAASYLASYVNCSNSLPKVLQVDSVRQKHSYSKGFGVSKQYFSLSSILEKARGGDLSYSVGTFKDGVPIVDKLPVPKYVINRFFPKFKGYSLLSDSEIRKLLLRTGELRKVISERSDTIVWSDDDEHRFRVRLLNIRKLFLQELGMSFKRFDVLYPIFYTMVWNCHVSTLNRMSYDIVMSNKDWLYFFENGNEIQMGLVGSSFLEFVKSCGYSDSDIVSDPNLRNDVVITTRNLTDLYYKKDKSKKVVNYAMSCIGHSV